MGVGGPVFFVCEEDRMTKRKKPAAPEPEQSEPPDLGPLVPKVTVKGFTITVTLEPMWADRQPKEGGNRKLMSRNGTAEAKGGIADDYVWRPKPPKE